MKIINKFPFLFAILSVLICLLSLVIKSQDLPFNKELMILSLYFAVIYYTWMIMHVCKTRSLRNFQRKFWLILTISVPFFGAMLYQLLHQRYKKIAT